MLHIDCDRGRILKLLVTIVMAISVSNVILAQDATKESEELNNTKTNLNSSDITDYESDTVMSKQQLNATLKYNTLKKELFEIDVRIKDVEQGKGHSSNRLIPTSGSSPVTLKELQKRQKQIIKELAKLRLEKSARVRE